MRACGGCGIMVEGPAAGLRNLDGSSHKCGAMKCARPGCQEEVEGDDYCSSECLRLGVGYNRGRAEAFAEAARIVQLIGDQWGGNTRLAIDEIIDTIEARAKEKKS